MKSLIKKSTCFVLGALVDVVSAQTRQYFFVSTSLNWTEAQSYCRARYTDLATIENTFDVSAAVNTSAYTGKWKWRLVSMFKFGVICWNIESFKNFLVFLYFWTGKAWIGLYDDLINGWRWSLNDSRFYGDGETEFRNWYTAQPNNLNDQQYCVELFTGSPYFGTWGDSLCSTQRPFVCYNGEFSYIIRMNSQIDPSKILYIVLHPFTE